MKTRQFAALLTFANLILLAACGAGHADISPAPPTFAPTPEPSPFPPTTPSTTTAAGLPKALDLPAPTATFSQPVLQIKKIDTRPGVTMGFAYSFPSNAKIALVLFTGGDGRGAFSVTGNTVKLGGNFIVRTTPSFIQQGFATAIIDVPSDQPNGFSPRFRASMPHAHDISKLIDYLDGQGLRSVYLLGTSNGTLSVAYLGTALHDPRIKGLVLAETTTGSSGPQTQNAIAWRGVPLGSITVPVLMTHNRNDQCTDAQYISAAQLAQRMTGSPKVDFVEVTLVGSPPQSGPCDAQSAHGYFGIEVPVVQAIADWISGKPVPAKIGP